MVLASSPIQRQRLVRPEIRVRLALSIQLLTMLSARDEDTSRDHEEDTDDEPDDDTTLNRKRGKELPHHPSDRWRPTYSSISSTCFSVTPFGVDFTHHGERR